jgi:hypothetical protein
MIDATPDLTANLPDVVAEVRALFERYEQALIEKNVDVLDATFWDSPHTIRYAFDENGYGFGENHPHRVARPPGPGTKERRIRLEILTIGHDLATVNLRVQGAGPRPRRPAEPDVGALPRARLEGDRRARLHHERGPAPAMTTTPPSVTRTLASDVDPVRFEVIRNALLAITEEMGATLRRAA